VRPLPDDWPPLDYESDSDTGFHLLMFLAAVIGILTAMVAFGYVLMSVVGGL